jgi:hydrogenase maturation protease
MTTMLKNMLINSRRSRSRILVAGLGNSLLQDDGVGVHAVRELRRVGLQGALVVEVGIAVLSALHLFEWADKILAIDAMEAGGSPGTIYLSGIDDIEQGSRQTSLHELSLVSALRFLRKKRTAQIMVLGVEPETIGYGLDLTSTLRTALPEVVQEARTIVSLWRGDVMMVGNERRKESHLRLPAICTETPSNYEIAKVSD